MEELKISKETAQLGIGAVMLCIDSLKNWKDDIYFDTVCNCCICKANFIADDGRQMCYECYSDDVS